MNNSNSYYVLIKQNNEESEKKYTSLEKAQEVALSKTNEEDVTYVEYGVLNWDNWQGHLAIAVLKMGEI